MFPTFRFSAMGPVKTATRDCSERREAGRFNDDKNKWWQEMVDASAQLASCHLGKPENARSARVLSIIIIVVRFKILQQLL
jgi:hypothetical protein